jgi:acetyl esterase/lipase
VQRKINRPKDLERVLGSNRFRHLRGSEICEDVLREDFAGHWICQGSLESKQSPSKSDVVIFWIHGGGYVLGHPLQPLAAMLHIAQGMEAHHNLSVSIFALEYTLAPEAALPTQQSQALSAYTYLIKDLSIDPSKIVVLGESAGGHLALTLLCGIAERDIPKPQGICLICPWVNLTNTGASFARNARKDILRKPFLDWCTDVAMPFSLRQQDSRYAHLLNSAVSSPNGRRWAAVLPPSTWVLCWTT